MISNGEKLWIYLTVKELSALLGKITPIYHGNFFCLNSLHSFAKEKKLESYKKVCENKDFYDVIIAYEELKYQNLINIKNLIKHYLLSMQILNV